MPQKATAADAELILKLYDLRREAEMRKARNWWYATFWPQRVDDVTNILMDMNSQEGAWFRQVSGYWNMTANLALAGAVNQELLLDPNFSGEMYFIFAKMKPFLKDLRKKLDAPDMFAPVEKLIASAKKSRDFLKSMETRVAARRKLMAEMAKAN